MGIHLAQKTSPQVRPQFGLVFDQAHFRRQLQLGQYVQRGNLHQARKPTVDGVNLNIAPRVHPVLMQLRQLGFQLGNPFRLNTPDDQFVTAVFNGLMRKLSQPGMQTLAHFTGGFFGKGDSQNVLWLHAIQQGPNDP